MYIKIYIYIHIYIYMYIQHISGTRPWGHHGKPLFSMDRFPPIFYFGGLFINEIVPGVLQAMGPNKQVQAHQLRASAGGNLLRYDRFCGP